MKTANTDVPMPLMTPSQLKKDFEDRTARNLTRIEEQEEEERANAVLEGTQAAQDLWANQILCKINRIAMKGGSVATHRLSDGRSTCGRQYLQALSEKVESLAQSLQVVCVRDIVVNRRRIRDYSSVSPMVGSFVNYNLNMESTWE